MHTSKRSVQRRPGPLFRCYLDSADISGRVGNLWARVPVRGNIRSVNRP